MSDPALWPAAALDGRIGEGEVQVWLALLDGPPPTAASCDATLSPDERERAARFVFARDRGRFVAARLLLRRLLASYLETEPAQVQFTYDRYGKPSIAGASSGTSFNVSHSGTAAVVAISRAGEVGVDIESLRPMPDAEDIAARFFAPGEQAALRSLPPSQRERAFFTCWTRKEAFVKAVGQGLSYPLASFEVTLRPDDPVMVRHTGRAADQDQPWALAALPVVAGYVGALVVRGRPRVIHYRSVSAFAQPLLQTPAP